VIRAFRDGGCQLPTPPDRDTIHRMMNFLVAQEVPEEYVPMMLEEMELDGRDHRTDAWGSEVPQQNREQHKVLVIGGGMSGVLAAVRLQEAGIPFVVIEKNASVGGTWFENRYPGARVDVSNHLYCYSFEPAHHWTQYFAQQPELQKYFEDVVENHRLQDNIRLNTEVTSASYDEEACLWQVETLDRDGHVELHRVNSVISAVGQLNRPKLPDVPGVESFRGQWCHSADWDPSIDYRGKRVIVVGAGASAFQVVPAIAADVAELTVFQRAAPWMFENPIYHEQVPEGKKWCLQHLPFYARWFRFLLFWCACDGAYESVIVDPEWPHQERSINEMNDRPWGGGPCRTTAAGWLRSSGITSICKPRESPASTPAAWSPRTVTTSRQISLSTLQASRLTSSCGPWRSAAGAAYYCPMSGQGNRQPTWA
jgi:4-hydroxyacetophenone monooxygenase